MPEENRPAEDRQKKEAGEPRAGQPGKGEEQKSTVDKMIDKAQEKGLTEKAANVVKGKLKGR